MSCLQEKHQFLPQDKEKYYFQQNNGSISGCTQNVRNFDAKKSVLYIMYQENLFFKIKFKKNCLALIILKRQKMFY